jgi:hypothetical protein
MQISPAARKAARARAPADRGGGTTNVPGTRANVGVATNPQARNPTAQPAPSSRAPSRGGPGRVNEGNTTSASPGQQR